MVHPSPHTERRRHPRYAVGDNVLVFSHDTFGQIMDISKSGLAYRYLTARDDTKLPDVELGFLNTENGFYIDKLYCKIIRSNDSTPLHPSSNTLIRTNGVEFTQLTDEQRSFLDSFLNQNIASIQVSTP
ncbi:MAG: PilZ domain-containing protein [Desulfobulbaceae bacterium]|uniref:PilZ domain-containing protein n=1 Tax=Candidatus Desulfobia pelagia TaxID=2841692 RepID=A0A8J6N7X1_9BACT|nr:PilZ domain-containing protein [Candidatus Desulfobia pelagia]